MSNDTPTGSTPSDAPDPLRSSDLPPTDAPSSPPPPPPPYGSAPPPPPDYGQAPSTPYDQAPPPPYGSAAPPPPPGYEQTPAYAQVPTGRNTKALWSMISGIVGLVLCGVVLGPLAIVLSRQAKNEIAASGGRQQGAGMAKAGLILGIIALVLWALVLFSRLGQAGR